MAEILDNVNWQTDTHTRYPWGVWFDGQARRLSKGTDFSSAPKNFATAAKQRGKALGAMVKTQVDEENETVILQAFQPDGTPRTGPIVKADEVEAPEASESEVSEDASAEAEPVPAGV